MPIAFSCWGLSFVAPQLRALMRREALGPTRHRSVPVFEALADRGVDLDRRQHPDQVLRVNLDEKTARTTIDIDPR
jgi:hypothetical protein